MVQAAKIIGTDLATTGLIGAGIGIGVVFGGLILGVARNPSLRGQLFSYAILGFAFSEVETVLRWLISFLNRMYSGLEWGLNNPPKPHSFMSLPLQSKVFFFNNFTEKLKAKFKHPKFWVSGLGTVFTVALMRYLYISSGLEIGLLLEVFSLSLSGFFVRHIFSAFYESVSLPERGPSAYKMDNPIATGSGTVNSGSNTSTNQGQGESSNTPISKLTEKEVKEYSSRISKSTAKLTDARRSLQSHVEDLEDVYKKESSSVSQRSKKYDKVVKSLEAMNELQAERNTLFGDVYVRNNGSLAALKHNPQQYPISNHNAIVNAQNIIERYKDK